MLTLKFNYNDNWFYINVNYYCLKYFILKVHFMFLKNNTFILFLRKINMKDLILKYLIHDSIIKYTLVIFFFIF